MFQVHKKIELFEYDKQAIIDSYAQLYNKDLSLADISKQTGKAKSVIRDNLIKAGVELRDKAAVPDPKEYENLMLIYRLWKLNTNPNRISDTLNEKKIRPRATKLWNRNSIVNILTRFEQKQIAFKGGQLELR